MSYDDFRRPLRPDPTRIVPRTVRPMVGRGRPGGLGDPDFDNFFAEAREMQRSMIKSVPWYMKAGVIGAFLLSALISIGIITLIVLGILALVN